MSGTGGRIGGSGSNNYRNMENAREEVETKGLKKRTDIVYTVLLLIIVMMLVAVISMLIYLIVRTDFMDTGMGKPHGDSEFSNVDVKRLFAQLVQKVGDETNQIESAVANTSAHEMDTLNEAIFNTVNRKQARVALSIDSVKRVASIEEQIKEDIGVVNTAIDGLAAKLGTPGVNQETIFKELENLRGGRVVGRRYIPLAPVLKENWASSNHFPVGVGFVAVEYRGHLLIWGGDQKQADKTRLTLPMNVVYLYDHDNNSWDKLPATGDIPDHSIGAAAVVFEDAVYVFGGENSGNERGNDIYRLRLEDEGESRKAVFLLLPVTGDRPSGRGGHKGWTYKRKLFFFAGAVTNGAEGNLVGPNKWDNRDNLLVQFDPETNKWMALETKGPRPSPRNEHDVARLGDEIIIHGGYSASGSSDLSILHMPTLTWTQFTTLSRIWGHSLTPISTKKVLKVGGTYYEPNLSNEIYVINRKKMTPENPIDSPNSTARSMLDPISSEFGEGLVYHSAVGVKGETGYAVVCLGGYSNGDRSAYPDHMIKFDIE